MARLPRIEYDGAVYHVTARGNERRDIFRDDEDRRMFLSTLEEAVALHGFKVHSYCLMPNHYHPLIETPRPNLSRAIGWVQSTYTIRFNRRHHRSGHLFQGRFKAHLVDADGYAMELLRYVHLNPVRPKEKTSQVPADRWAQLERYHWSSHRFYSGAVPPPEWLDLSWLAYFGKTAQAARKGYLQFLKQAVDSDIPSPWDVAGKGGVLGDEEFRAKVAKYLSYEASKLMIAETPKLRAEVIHRLVAGETIPWQIWLRVRYGEETRIAIAHSLGNKDGSAVTHILKRLEARCNTDASEAAHAAALLKKLSTLYPAHRH